MVDILQEAYLVFQYYNPDKPLFTNFVRTDECSLQSIVTSVSEVIISANYGAVRDHQYSGYEDTPE